MTSVFKKFTNWEYRDMVLSILSFLILLVMVILAAKFRNVIIYCMILLFSLLLIITSADLFLEGAKAVAKRLGLSEFIVGLTIVSIGTSVPEIASTATASYHGHADLAIGNIYGSVLVQITFILGIVVLFCPIKTDATVIKRDGLCMLGAVFLLTLFTAWDKTLQTWQGIILILIYLAYLAYLLIYFRKKGMDDDKPNDDLDNEKDEMGMGLGIAILFLALGLGFVIFSANKMVDSASTISEKFNMEESIIGTSITAFGTSVPELIVAGVAIKKAKSLALGTLIGSNITDPLFSIGIASIFNPIVVLESVTVFYFLAPITLVACTVAILFMITDLKLVRWEGSVLILLYLIAVVGMFMGWHISLSAIGI